MNLPSLFSGWWAMFTPMLLIPVVYALRRRTMGGRLAVLAAGGTAWLTAQLPQPETVYLLGRPLIFSQLWVFNAVLLLSITAVLFVSATSISQGWSFYPFGLVILLVLMLAGATKHLGISAMLVEIAALLAVFIIQAGRPGSVRGGLRFLVMMTLALPLFLPAARYSELYRDRLRDPLFLAQLGLLVGGGFGLWLGVFPVHGWSTAIATEASPGVTAFILVAFPATAVLILLQYLAQAPWLLDTPNARQIIVMFGLLSVVAGGFFASVQTRFDALMGYTALFDIGGILLALGLGSQAGITLILLGLVNRTIGLVLIGVNTASIQTLTGGTTFKQASGLARQHPLTALGLMVGAATLAGAPFTAGFVSRWLLLRPLAALDPRWAVILLLGSLGITIGYLRGLRALVEPLPNKPAPRRHLRPQVVTPALVTLCLGIGLFPRPVLALIQSIIATVNIPIL